METGSAPARWGRTKDCPRTWLWTIHRRADNCADSPKWRRRLSRSNRSIRSEPGPATGRDRARYAPPGCPIAAARAWAPAVAGTPAAAAADSPAAAADTPAVAEDSPAAEEGADPAPVALYTRNRLSRPPLEQLLSTYLASPSSQLNYRTVLSPPSPTAAPIPTTAPIKSEARAPVIRVTIPISIRIGVGIRIGGSVAVRRSIGRSHTVLNIIRPFVIVRTHPAERLRRRFGGHRHGSFHPERQDLLGIKVCRPAARHEHADNSGQGARSGANCRASAPVRCRANGRASRGSPGHCTHISAHRRWTILTEQLGLQWKRLPIQKRQVGQLNRQPRNTLHAARFLGFDYLSAKGLPAIRNHYAIHDHRFGQRSCKPVSIVVAVRRQTLVQTYGDEGARFNRQLCWNRPAIVGGRRLISVSLAGIRPIRILPVD